MTRIIVTTSGKGGVGKTTVTANLGMALARLGRSVALVDADFGLRNLDLLLGLENRVVYTAVEVANGECRLEQALVKDKREPKLVLLPAAQNRNKEAMSPEQMKQLVEELTKTYDYIIIDSPAGIEMGFKNAIAPAREALIVTTPEIAAVRDADRVVGLLEAEQELLAIGLIGVVPEDERVIVSTNRGEPLVLAEDPSMAGKAFDNIARRLEGENIEFLDLQPINEGFLSRLRKLFWAKPT